MAIRRLRSTARAYQDDFDGSLSKKDRRALATLQRATGPGRDAEVGLEWLVPQRASLSEEQCPGFDALVSRLTKQKSKCYARARKRVRKDFLRMSNRSVQQKL